MRSVPPVLAGGSRTQIVRVVSLIHLLTQMVLTSYQPAFASLPPNSTP